MTATTTPSPDELLEAFRLSVRAALAADLAAWPPVFCRRLRGMLDRETRDFAAAHELYNCFRDARRPDAANVWSSLIEALDDLRTALDREPRDRAEVEAEQTALLERLWFYGRRRLDPTRWRTYH